MLNKFRAPPSTTIPVRSLFAYSPVPNQSSRRCAKPLSRHPPQYTLPYGHPPSFLRITHDQSHTQYLPQLQKISNKHRVYSLRDHRRKRRPHLRHLTILNLNRLPRQNIIIMPLKLDLLKSRRDQKIFLSYSVPSSISRSSTCQRTVLCNRRA